MIKSYLAYILLFLSFSIYSQEEEIIEETVIEEVEMSEPEDEQPTGIAKFSENRAYGLKNYNTNTVMRNLSYQSSMIASQYTLLMADISKKLIPLI